MKNTSFLAIFDTLFIVTLIIFMLTKNSTIFFVSLPFYVGTSFSQYFKQKEKLDVVDKKLLNLLKLDTTIYSIAFMILYVSIYSSINSIELPLNINYFFGIALFLFFVALIISIKRRKLAQDLLIEKYRRKIMTTPKKGWFSLWV